MSYDVPAEPGEDRKPHAYVSWPKDGVRLAGDPSTLTLGKKARVVLEGTVTGYAMQKYGCSIDLEVKTVAVEPAGDGNDDAGESLVVMVGKMRRRTKGED